MFDAGIFCDFSSDMDLGCCAKLGYDIFEERRSVQFDHFMAPCFSESSNLEENFDLDSSFIPIKKGSLSPPEKEKAPINIKGKKRLNRIACLFLKNILRKTLAKCICNEVIIYSRRPLPVRWRKTFSRLPFSAFSESNLAIKSFGLPSDIIFPLSIIATL